MARRLRPLDAPCRWFGRGGVLCLALAAAVATAADPGSRGALVCREGRVEMIVGGTESGQCAETTASVRPNVRSAAASFQPSRLADTVPGAVQRDRDRERRRILATELAQEESRLAVDATSPDATAAARTRENVLALRRELARLAPEAPAVLGLGS